MAALIYRLRNSVSLVERLDRDLQLGRIVDLDETALIARVVEAERVGQLPQ